MFDNYNSHDLKTKSHTGLKHMKYGAITLDTSIFERHGLVLEGGLLQTLEQFKGKPSHLILSEIIIRELNDHLVKKITTASLALTKALKTCSIHLTLDQQKIEQAQQLLVPETDNKKLAKDRINIFLGNTGAEIISASANLDVDTLIKNYFDAVAPFSGSGKKKSEFPDAIALMGLEAWAIRNNTKILAVSDDSDWESFANSSEHIDLEKNLASAISIFQPDGIAKQFCLQLAKDLPAGNLPDMYHDIDQQILESVNGLDVSAEADSQFYWEPEESVEINFNNFEFVCDDNGVALLNPIQSQDGIISVEAIINVNAQASCSFSLSVHDSIDRDDVYMGSSSQSIVLEYETEILITLVGDFAEDPDNVVVQSVEMLHSIDIVDFGQIEPDWFDDPYD